MNTVMTFFVKKTYIIPPEDQAWACEASRVHIRNLVSRKVMKSNMKHILIHVFVCIYCIVSLLGNLEKISWARNLLVSLMVSVKFQSGMSGLHYSDSNVKNIFKGFDNFESVFNNSCMDLCVFINLNLHVQ